MLVVVPASICAAWAFVLLTAFGVDPSISIRTVPPIFVLVSIYCACVVLPSSMSAEPNGVLRWASFGTLHACVALVTAFVAVGSIAPVFPARIWTDLVFLVLIGAVPVGAAAGLCCREMLVR